MLTTTPGPPMGLKSNVFITILILLGPAVGDSVSGKDVYLAFAVRMDLFAAVTIYAWAAIVALEYLRARRGKGVSYALPADSEDTAC